MKIRDFEYLIELEQAGTINKAAQANNISQQGFSRALDTIEGELGARLVERSRQGVRFTPEGKAFLKHARSIVREYYRAVGELAAHRAVAEPKKLHVTISSYIALVLFEQMMDAIPFESEVVYHEQRLNWIYDEIARADTDRIYLIDWMGALEEGRLPHREGWTVVEVASSRMGVITDHANASDGITREEMATRPLAAFGSEDYERTIDRLLGERGAENVVVSLSNRRVIAEKLRNLKGSYTITDQLSCQLRWADGDGLAFVPIEPAVHLKLGFLYLADSPQRETYERYIEAWKEAFRQLTHCAAR